MKMIIITGDFTDSDNTGIRLAKKGTRTEVMLTPAQKPSRRADVLIINMESRAMPATQAAAAVQQALAPWCEGEAIPLIYKKVDSTFRGNVGAKVTATIRTAGQTLVVIAAAIPAAGRTTQDGLCLIHDVPLLETGFASDPKTPIRSSRITELVMLQSDVPIHEMSLVDTRQGSLGALLGAFVKTGECVVVVDAVEEQDLALIAQAVCGQKQIPLFVGTAGLANALPAAMFIQGKQELSVLVVAGSTGEATRRQVEKAVCQGRAKVADIDAARLIASSFAPGMDSVIEQACAQLSQQQHTILHNSRCAEDRGMIDTLYFNVGVSHRQLEELLDQRLGEITLRIIEQACIDGLFLAGGDITTVVASALGAEGYRIHSGVAPCIPCGTFVNSEVDDLPVITRAGEFGSDTTLYDALYFIEEMCRDN